MRVRMKWFRPAIPPGVLSSSEAQIIFFTALRPTAGVEPGQHCYPNDMKHHRYLVTLLLVATLASCRSSDAPATKTAALSQEIQLSQHEHVEYGQQAELDVEFVRVVDDSRCPKDATCVWAGEVNVQLATRVGAAEAVMHEIKAGQSASVGPYRLSVLAVGPERISTQPISPQAYRVTVKVDQL